MKNSFKTTILTILTLVLTTSASFSTVLNADYLKQEIQKGVIKEVKTITDGDVSVMVLKLPFDSIEVPDGKIKIISNTNLKNFNPYTVVKINVLVNNRIEKTFGVTAEITIQDKAWVVNDFVAKGSTITPNNVILEKTEISSIINKVVKKDFTPYGYLARKNFKQGDILDSRYIESAPDVMKNTLVSIIFKTDKITITADAISLDNGKIGDFVKVRSSKYKKDYIGKVVDSNTVLVRI